MTKDDIINIFKELEVEYNTNFNIHIGKISMTKENIITYFKHLEEKFDCKFEAYESRIINVIEFDLSIKDKYIAIAIDIPTRRSQVYIEKQGREVEITNMDVDLSNLQLFDVYMNWILVDRRRNNKLKRI